MIKFKHFLTEDLEHHFSNRAIGMISAQRGHLSPEENDARHEQLRHDLERRGHLVHDAEGHYEGQKEKSFLVSHHSSGNDNGVVASSLVSLGKKYDQDSVLLKPHHSPQAYLQGTNSTGFPGLDKIHDIGTFHSGEQNGNYSKVRGRTFHFGKSVDETLSTNALKSIEILKKDPNSPPAMKAAAHKVSSGQKLQDWEGQERDYSKPNIDEDDEWNMDDHHGALLYHGHTPSAERSDVYYNKNKTSGVHLGSNYWTHQYYDRNKKQQTKRGIFADTLHDSLKNVP